ncbi:hypothetical protein D3C78_712760 [compost metagenome]
MTGDGRGGLAFSLNPEAVTELPTLPVLVVRSKTRQVEAFMPLWRVPVYLGKNARIDVSPKIRAHVPTSLMIQPYPQALVEIPTIQIRISGFPQIVHFPHPQLSGRQAPPSKRVANNLQSGGQCKVRPVGSQKLTMQFVKMP